MEAIIFCGIQASGKSTFYKENFFNSHVRISLDLLRTRKRERAFLDTCIATHQRFVVDNTNPTGEDRGRYIGLAKEAGYKVICYYFQSSPEEAIERNKQRKEKEQVPDAGIWATYKKLKPPSAAEGFDFIKYLQLVKGFNERWQFEASILE